MGNHITLEKVAEIRLRKQKRVMNAYFCEYTVGDVKVEAIYIAPSRGTVRSITVLNYRESYGKDSPIRFTYPMRITLAALTDGTPRETKTTKHGRFTKSGFCQMH